MSMAIWHCTAAVKAILSLITIIITLRICYVLLLNKESYSHLGKPIKYISIVGAIFFSLATTTNFAGRFYMHIEGLTVPGETSHKNNLCQTLFIFGTFFNGSGIVLLYLLFLCRLITVYRSSTFKFKISLLTIILLYTSLVILFMLSLCGVILLIFYYWGFISVSIHMYWSSISWISTECVHLIISISLIYLFVSTSLRLFYIISHDRIRNKDHLPDTYGSLDSGHSGWSRLTFNEYQQSILNDITKQGIISVTGIVSTQLHLATMAMAIEASDHTNKQYRSIILAILTCAYSLDCMVNCLCILMTFSTQTTLYLAICGKCDRGLQTLCVQCVKKPLRQQYQFSNRNRYNSYKSLNESSEVEIEVELE